MQVKTPRKQRQILNKLLSTFNHEEIITAPEDHFVANESSGIVEEEQDIMKGVAAKFNFQKDMKDVIVKNTKKHKWYQVFQKALERKE